MSSYPESIPALQLSPPPQFQPIPSPDEGSTASTKPSSTVTYFSPPPPPLVSSYSPPLQSSYEPPPPPAISTITPILFSSPPPPLLPPPPPPLSAPPPPLPLISSSSPPPPPPLISSPPPPPPLISSSSPPPPPLVTEPPSIPPQSSTTHPPPKPPPHILKPRIPLPRPLHIGRPSSHINNSRIKHNPPPSHRNNNVAMTGASAGIAALAGLMMLSFVGAGIWFVRQRKRMPPPPVPDTTYQRAPSFPTTRQSSGGYRFAYSATDPGLSSSISFFTYEDLSYMTNGFSSQNLLAQGGFGPVYRGTSQDGREVAIKQLKIGGAQGDREFRAEVDIISRVHHRHLVSLVGYCVLDQERLLIYDYVPNNTLYHHLHGLGSPIMDWAARVKIAVGAARGIAYLHEDCHPRIIHRDIKSSNILLDNNFEAQVSDFGLAKLVTDACTHVSTRVMGTFGYLAPEYASTGKLTAKSDVYSFGVVLLELITGRKPVDVSQHIGDESLVEWARPLLNRALETGEIGELTDPRLEKRYNYREMFQIIEAAAACVRRTATLRPRMAQVVRALDSMSDSDLTNGVRPGVSGVINSGPNTEEIEIFRRSRFARQY